MSVRKEPLPAHSSTFGLVSRQPSEFEAKAARLRRIAAVLGCVAAVALLFSRPGGDVDRFAVFVREHVAVPLLVVSGAAAIVCLYMAHRTGRYDPRLQSGEWVLRGLVWNRDLGQWQQGTVNVKVQPSGYKPVRSRQITESAGIEAPSGEQQSGDVELVINLTAPWRLGSNTDSSYTVMRTSLYEMSPFLRCGRSALPLATTELYVLAHATLEPFLNKGETVVDSLRRLGNLLHGGGKFAPLTVSINLHTPEVNPNEQRHLQRRMMGSAAVVVGEGLENAAVRQRNAFMQSMLHGDEHAFQSDNLGLVSKSFSWRLLVDGRPAAASRGTTPQQP